MSDIKLPKRYLIQCNTKSFFSLKEWLNKNAGKLNLDWASIIGNPEDNPALIQYIDNKIVELLTVPQDVTVNGSGVGTINNQLPTNINITDGTNLVLPISIVVSGNNINIIIPKQLNIVYKKDDDTIIFTVLSGSEGVYTTINTTGLTSVVIEVNSTVVTAPITLAIGDIVEISFDPAAADGVIIFEE